MGCPRGSPQPAASRDATFIQGTKACPKVLVPSPQGAAGPREGLMEAAGVPLHGAGAAGKQLRWTSLEMATLRYGACSQRRGASTQGARPATSPGLALCLG